MPEVEDIRHRIAGLAAQLRSRTAHADPVLWAAASALDAADLLLTTYEKQDQVHPVDHRRNLLEALGSARAAVSAATYAAQGAASAR